MKFLRRIIRCFYEGSVFNIEWVVFFRRWWYIFWFLIIVFCINVVDLIMKDFGKFFNKVVLVSILWLFMYWIYIWSYNLFEDIIKDIDVFNGNWLLKFFNSWRYNFFSFVEFY